MKDLQQTTRFMTLLGFFYMALPGAIAQADKATNTGNENSEGYQLYQRYGCSNCHGKDGINTETAYVPPLRGKSPAVIQQAVTDILGGSRMSANARLMHNQYCADAEENDAACADAPSGIELALIAGWLADAAPLPKKKTTPQELYLTALEAYDLVSNQPEDVLFLDVRTRSEVTFIGMPQLVDANIPFMREADWSHWDTKKGTYKLAFNPDFVEATRAAITSKGLHSGNDTKIILLCRSGNRSAKAARVLHVAGFGKVYSVIDGFEGDKAGAGKLKGQRIVNGWKNHGLPWSYRLEKEKLL